MADDAPLFETMRTAGARRRFKPDPVSDAQVSALIEAAVCAPSARNSQTWAFIAVRDAVQRAAVATLYKEAWYEAAWPGMQQRPPADEAEARDRRAWRWLADHMDEAPLLIFCCLRGPAPAAPVQAAPYYGSIFPAMQNLILAARALGLGTTLTTVHKLREPQLKALLGAPDTLDLVALLPVGYPVNPFRSLRRRPASEVLHFDRWGGAV